MNSFSGSVFKRKNMVDCQLATTNVFDRRILDSFQAIPRELFMPDNCQGGAYVDDTMHFGNGRFMMSPSLHARMIQALNLQSSEAVLDIGCGTGYGSAILSGLVKTVIALDDSEDNLSLAKANWDRLSLYNIAAMCTDMRHCGIEHAPYDAIIINGAVSKIPEEAVQCLDKGGRLCCVVCKNTLPSGKKIPHEMSVGKVMLVHKHADGSLTENILFETELPYLEGFAPEKEFLF